MLVIYARDLKEGFVEYAEPVGAVILVYLYFIKYYDYFRWQKLWSPT